MALPMPNVLQPSVINETVSRLNVVNTIFQDFFGLRAGASRRIPGRNFGWDIFDRTRTMATGRAPGTPFATRKPQVVGHVSGTFPRFHEAIPLLYEDIHNIRKIGGPVDTLDLAGEAYLREQEGYLAQKFNNAREFMASAIIRGSFGFTVYGDDLMLGYTDGQVKVDFQVPAGNKSRLDMLGAGNIISADWDVAGTDIPLQLYQINAAMEQLTGRQLRHVIINSTTWNYVTSCTKVINLAGSAARPFTELSRNNATNDFTAFLAGVPWITWHITDGGLSVGTTGTETFTKFIPDKYAAFLPDPDPSWIKSYEGSEIVVEWDGAPAHEEYGDYFYARPTSNPAGYELVGLMNQIPALLVPNCVAYGQIDT